jgi:hypothetical protein
VRLLTLIVVVVAAEFTLLPTLALCQEEKKKSEIPPSGIVTLDLSARSFGATPLPFDVPFQLRGKVAPKTSAILARYGLLDTATGRDQIAQTELGCTLWTRELPRDSSRAAESEFVLDFPIRLRADKEYLFVFTLYEPLTGALPAQAESPRCNFYEQLKRAGPVTFLTTDSLSIRGSTRTEYKQRFDTDVGFLVTGGARYRGIASGVHFHLWPINKSADLADFNFVESLQRRISIFGGLAVTKLGTGIEVDHLLGLGSPMLGVGFRGPLYWRGFAPGPDWAIRPMRLNAGVIWFKQDPANPVVDESETRFDLFVSASYDLDILGILGPFASLLPK